MKKLKYIFFTVLALSILIIVFWGRIDKLLSKRNELITVEATFMQYACGDDNVDMQLISVNDSSYSDLIGKDIDPSTKSTYKLKDYFFDNKSEEFGMKYRLTGHMSNKCMFGCDNSTPKFYVETIEKMDGSMKQTKDDF